MKKILSIISIILIALQINTVSFAFTDTQPSPFINKKYTHDDRFLNYEIMNGIDISSWQSSADFKKAKAYGVDFVILRAGYRGYGTGGNLCKDAKFDEYVTSAISAGLDVGAYIYSQAITVKEAREEADYILNIVKGYDIKLPIVLDFEYYATGVGRLYNANLTNAQRTSICNAFCKRIENNGYTAMVYANQSMLTDDLNDENIANNYDIWLANYSTIPKYAGKMYDCDYSFWQYTSSGKVDGISGNVDCNFRYYKKPVKTTGLNVSEETLEKTTLNWTRQKGVYGYQVYKLNKETEKYQKIATLKGASSTTYTDTNTNGLSNSYKVRAVKAYKGSLQTGSYSDILTTNGIFKLSSTKSTAKYTNLSWYACNNAVNYNVLKASSPNGEYKKIAELDNKSLEYSDTSAYGFTTCYYKIEAIIDENTSYFTDYIEVKKPQPTANNVYLKSNKQAYISWNCVENADGSEIYKKQGDNEYKLIKTINNNTTDYFINNNLALSNTYYYKVRQFVTIDGVKYYSNFTSAKPVKNMKQAKIQLTSQSSSVTVNITPVINAQGYEIYMKVGKKFTLIKTTTKLSYTKTKLKSKTKYYFKVRAYKKVNGQKVYAPFSVVKSIKTK